MVPEDDGTDPKRGAEVVEKLANQHKVDFVYGPPVLARRDRLGAAGGGAEDPVLRGQRGLPRRVPASSNRYVFQPGITDVRAQVTAMAPWVMDHLGKRVTMMYPDYAFGYDHRDYFSAAVEARGGSVAEMIAIPPTESSYTRYFPADPGRHRGALPTSWWGRGC